MSKHDLNGLTPKDIASDEDKRKKKKAEIITVWKLDGKGEKNKDGHKIHKQNPLIYTWNFIHWQKKIH